MPNKLSKKNNQSLSTVSNEKFKPEIENKLRKLYLENFKGFTENNTIDFSPSINLFYGKNSAGKSSIIQSLRLLKQSLLILGAPVPLLFVLPSYTRVTGSLTFPEGASGIINSKDKNKQLTLGLSSFGRKLSKKESNVSRYIINKFNLKKNNELFLNGISFGRNDVIFENNETLKKISDHKLVFKKNVFKKGKLSNLLSEAHKNPRFNFDFNINNLLERKDISLQKKIYESLQVNKSYFKLIFLDEIYKKILTNPKKVREKINNLISKSLKKNYGAQTEDLKKIFKMNKKGKDADDIFEIGKFSQIKNSELIKLRSFVNSKDFLNKDLIEKFFMKDFKNKLKIIRYREDLIDLGLLKANMDGLKMAMKSGVLPAREYDVYLYNILLEALEEINFDIVNSHKQCLEVARRTLDKIVVVPGLRALPQRYLKRGLQENLIGENAENLGDLIAQSDTKKNLNQWFDKFGIPYSISADLVGNFYEIKLTPKGKKFKLSYRDVGLGYSLSLPLLVTCLTQTNAIILIEEPELHLHPKMQASLMDLFLYSSIKFKNQFIIETHSENLLLRAQKCIRKGFEINGKKISIGSECINVNNVYTDGISSKVQKILLNNSGEFKTHWKDGFFAERLDEIF